MKFRIFTKRTTILSAYDSNEETGEWASRKGILWDIEFWLHKFSIEFSFVWWSETE